MKSGHESVKDRQRDNRAKNNTCTCMSPLFMGGGGGIITKPGSWWENTVVI